MIAEFDYVIFLFGCIGAAAPEIVRVYRTRKYNFSITWRMALVSFLFFVLGGVIAVVLEASSWYAAFYSGAATPLLVSKVGERSPLREARRPVETLDKGSSSGPPLPVIDKLDVRGYLWMLNA